MGPSSSIPSEGPVQSTREHTTEQPQSAAAPRRPSGVWLTVYELVVTLPVLAVAILGIIALMGVAYWVVYQLSRTT